MFNLRVRKFVFRDTRTNQEWAFDSLTSDHARQHIARQLHCETSDLEAV
jgi:hypothetical protein